MCHGCYRKRIDEVAKRRIAAASRAIQIETELRIDNGQRADRFVAEWRQEVRRYLSQRKAWDINAADRTRTNLMGMVKSLKRDPQLESLLNSRRVELGLRAIRGEPFPHALAGRFGRSRSIGIAF